jgi:hypothetical protein
MERMTRHTIAFRDEPGSRILDMLSFAGFTILLILEGFFHTGTHLKSVTKF